MDPVALGPTDKFLELFSDAVLLTALGAAVSGIFAFMRNVLHVPARWCAGILSVVVALIWFFFTHLLPVELQDHIVQTIVLILGSALSVFHFLGMKAWFGNAEERAEAKK